MLQASTITPDTYIQAATLAVAILIAIVGYKVQIGVGDMEKKQAAMETRLVATQTAMQRDMEQKHNDNRLAIQVHQAEDKLIFEGISRTLGRMDHKLDRLNGVSH